jgi:hypothetical protein
MTQAVTNRPHIPEDWFQSQASSSGIYCGQGGTETCFSPSTEVALSVSKKTKHISDGDLCSRPICGTGKEMI